MKIKKSFLILSFVMLTILGLLYGISPRWFAETFLDIPEMSLDFAHMLRALMCLYLGLGLFWLYSAFCDKYRNAAVLTTMIFACGLLTGRIISLIADGKPSPLLLVYTILELGLVPVAFWIFRLPD
ncbi:MAG: DUF4345 domain-containing protein [Planctomycetota bacterium]